VAFGHERRAKASLVVSAHSGRTFPFLPLIEEPLRLAFAEAEKIRPAAKRPDKSIPFAGTAADPIARRARPDFSF